MTPVHSLTRQSSSPDKSLELSTQKEEDGLLLDLPAIKAGIVYLSASR